MEELVRALAEVVRPAGSPFEPELVVVQSKGMERWVGLELSRVFGVWANARFPFPRAFVDELLDRVLGEPEQLAQAWARESLTWSIAALLPRLAELSELELVRSYLKDDPRGARRFQLAERIAHVFDQYAVYRPELVLGWEAGKEPSSWQAVTWRALVDACGPGHLARRAARFFERWRALSEPPPGLPERVCVFGVSALPPVHLQLLAAVSERSDVHLFLLSPSREFWAQIRSRREIARAEREAAGAELHLAEGNALLASLGRVGRDFSQVLEDSVDYAEAESARYVDPGADTLLHALQSDVTHLRLRGEGPGRAPRLPLAADDRSLEIHSCHGPMREVEVLRDRLLDLFERDPTLQPHDVIVMTPDIDAYAPLIDAVFGDVPGSAPALPYRIADRSERADSEVAGALSTLLEVLAGRMKASEVMDLLQLEPVRARFAIDAEELASIQRWVHESGVRWGVDAEHRRAAGQPAISENTWRFGLTRLLLGWAMPGDGKTLFCGALPYDDVEGDAAESIGRLAELCETLFAFRERVAAPRTVEEWKNTIGDLVSATIATDEPRAWQLRRVREVLAQIAEQAARAGFVEPVSLDVFSDVLRARLASERTTHAFLSGGVTFCALLPMRSIPFRVVCLLGLGDEDFPRRDRAPAFDRIAESPRAGDRSLSDEDRYLFLEALLSARDHLLVTYVGRGIQDDRPRPPSVVVGELLDAIDDGFALDEHAPKRRPRRGPPAGQMAFEFVGPEPQPPAVAARKLSERIVIEHPLQPFSPRYFGAGDDPRLFSYAAEEAEGARALASARTVLSPFASAALAAEPDQLDVDLDELARFFENPTRGFLRRLGVDLDERPELVEDREPIDPSALARYDVGQRLVARALAGDDPSDAERLLRAEGLLPIGTPGRAWFAELAPEAREIARAARAFGHERRVAPYAIEVPLERGAVRGVAGDLWEGAQLVCSYSRLKAKNLLALWIRHLALCAAPPPSGALRSVLVGRPRETDRSGVASAVFAPIAVDRALVQLSQLTQLYRLGRRAPLCLFPATAEVYVGKLRGGDPDAALAAARKRFVDGFGFGEGGDASVKLLFGAADPLQPGFRPVLEVDGVRVPDFDELARRVLTPLIEALEECS